MTIGFIDFFAQPYSGIALLHRDEGTARDSGPNTCSSMYSYPQCYQILTKYKQYFGRGVVLLFLLTNWLRQVEAEELGRSSRLLSPHPRTYTDTKSIRRRLGNAGTFATQCQPGQYVTADNLCENCGQGKFERDGECIPCLQGKYGEKEGQTSCSTCSGKRQARPIM